MPIGKVSSHVTCHNKRECSISRAAGAGRILVLHYSSQYSAQRTNGREIALCSGAPHALTMISRFEDFAECFPTYVEEDRNGASATFNSIADYIEAQNFVRSVYIYILMLFRPSHVPSATSTNFSRNTMYRRTLTICIE